MKAILFLMGLLITQMYLSGLNKLINVETKALHSYVVAIEGK